MMSFLETLRQKGAEAREKLTQEIGKFRNRDFMEACVAGCALVAAADGNVSSEEKQKMVGFMRNSDELKVFDIEEVIAVFNKVVANFEFDPIIGKAEALKRVAVIKSKPDAARLMVRVCCAIGAADGNFDDNEKAMVAEICRELGLDPQEFGV